MALLHFARSTDCRVIAEGIETEPERATLRKLGVELGQGFLLGRPDPASAFQEEGVAAARAARAPARGVADRAGADRAASPPRVTRGARDPKVPAPIE